MPAAFPEGIQTLFTLFPQGTLALVGGYVRKWALNDGHVGEGTEADFATTLTPDESQALLQSANLLSDSPGLRWGTVTARVDGTDYEITSTRTETYAKNNRYPTATFGASWQQDAARRDFTCNALYLHMLSPLTGLNCTLTDPYQGVKDLQNHTVRFIGDTLQRLAEDPLRLLRFARFSAMYGLGGWTNEVETALKASLPALATLTAAKKTKEISGIQGHPYTEAVIKRLQSLGLAIS